jgi:hypothetical protein
MRHTIEIAADNMGRALHGCIDAPSETSLVADDRSLADWLIQQLDDMSKYLDIAVQSAGQIIQITAGPKPEPSMLPFAFVESGSNSTPAMLYGKVASPAPVEQRLGFSIDAKDYSVRSHTQQEHVQRRVSEIVGNVLADIRLNIADTFHQGTGDGIHVFLPPHIEAHRALAHLIRSTAHWLTRDNDHYQDQLRLRLTATFGPVSQATLGFPGGTIVESARLLDSQPLRDFLNQNPDIDLAVMISDALHGVAVRDELHPGLQASEFHLVEVTVKQFRRSAWLWRPPKINPS